MAIDIGVVANAGGFLPTLFKFGLERVATGPERMQIEAEVGAAVLDDAGKTDGDAVEGDALRLASSGGLVLATDSGERTVELADRVQILR